MDINVVEFVIRFGGLPLFIGVAKFRVPEDLAFSRVPWNPFEIAQSVQDKTFSTVGIVPWMNCDFSAALGLAEMADLSGSDMNRSRAISIDHSINSLLQTLFSAINQFRQKLSCCFVALVVDAGGETLQPQVSIFITQCCRCLPRETRQSRNTNVPFPKFFPPNIYGPPCSLADG